MLEAAQLMIDDVVNFSSVMAMRGEGTLQSVGAQKIGHVFGVGVENVAGAHC
jgi:hypothetical protein